MSTQQSTSSASCNCMGPLGDCPCIRRMREAYPPQPFQPMYGGWECPRCHAIYSPSEKECWRCNPAQQITITCGAPAQ